MHSKEWNELFKHCEILVYDSGSVLVSVLLGCDAALLDDGCSTFEDMNIDISPYKDEITALFRNIGHE